MVAEPEARHSSTQKAELAVLLADPRAEYPPYEIARQNRQDGPFFQPQVIHVASEVFVNDYLTHLTQRYNEPTNDEVIRWDFISPVAANNKTSRGSAASLEWRYRAQGSDPADFKANYKLEVKIWDRSCPSGRVLYRRQEKTKLCFLRPHCAIAARDLGVWEVHMTRNGQDAGMKAFDVKLPPVADQEGFSRRLNEGYRPLDSDGAFTSDEWLHHQKTYTPEPPNRRGRQKQSIEWDFKSPTFKENCNRRGAYYSLTQEYESDGQNSTVRERLYDSLYPQGHTYRISTSTGRLESLRLLGGPALSNFGDLTFKERVSGEVHSQKIPVRKILAFVQLPAGNMYQNNGSTAYQVRVATFPESWDPGEISWKLKLRNASNNNVLATFEGLFLEDSNQGPLKTALQQWDGIDEETGQKPPAGTVVVPELEISLFESDAPELAQLQRAAALRTEGSFVAQAQANAETYMLAGEVGQPVEVDDDLYIYLDDEREPVWFDDDGVTSYVTPIFQARRGQRVRIVAVDSFGLCRRLEGPLYLYHQASGQRQLLRRFYFDDGCRGWPAGLVFLDLHYPILIPSSSATPQSVRRALLPADCFPNLSAFDREFINRNSLPPYYSIGPECRPVDTRPSNGIRYTAQLDTLNDSRGREPYPFPRIQFCSPIPLSLDPTNGRYSHRFVDLSIPTRGFPLNLGRNYQSDFEQTGPNFGWRWDFEEYLTLIPGANQVVLKGPDGTECTFSKRGDAYTADRPEQTEKLKKLDDRHYEILFTNQTRHTYEIPSDVAISVDQAQRAVLKQKIDRNGNALTYLWSGDGLRLNKIQGPVAAQYLKLSWSRGTNPRLLEVEDHTKRCVRYDYQAYSNPAAENGKDYLLSKITQPGGTVYQHTYHQVMGEGYYRLLETYFNGELQEKIGTCDDHPGSLEKVSHHASAIAYERVNEDGQTYTRLTKSGAMGTPEDQDQVTQSFLDDLGRVITQFDPQGNSVQYEYDIRNNMTVVTDEENVRTEMYWDANHNLLTLTDALARVTQIVYDGENNPATIIDALGQVTEFYYDERSNLTAVVDNLGHSSNASYNEFGLLTSVTNNLGHTWNFGYNALGFLSRKTTPATSDGQPAATWEHQVDSLGRTVRTLDPLGRVYQARYDERDRLVEASVPEVSARYRQEAQCRRSIYKKYDRSDLLLWSTALDGRKTRYEYDDCHQLTAAHLPGYPNPVRLEYDSFENLVKMTNTAGQSTLYAYDILNRVKETTYPNQDKELYRYDNRGNLVEWERGGQLTTYQYDTLSRLTLLNSPDTQDLLTWEYDTLDRVARMQDSSGGSTEYTYTPNNLLESIFRSDGRGLQYQYDLNDRLASIQDHEGDLTQYAYNERNELKEVTHDERTVRYNYDLVGRKIATQLPNGVISSMAFDERNRLIRLHHEKDAQPLLTFKYGHNQLGQRIMEEKTSPQQCKLSRFTFNPRRELIRSDRRVNGGCHNVTEYRYDLNHNRIGQNQFTYQHNAADQLLQANGTEGFRSLSYNGQGQATVVGDFDFTYNHNQQIKTATGPQGQSSYFYDGNGRRVAKEVNGDHEDYLLLGHEVLKTYQNGSLKAKYLLGLGREGIKTDSGWNYYLTDGLGSTIALVDESGAPVAEYDYTDYGETTQIAGDPSTYNPFLYTGQEWDAELGMYNLRARHYSPSLGRFIARDPIGYAGGSNLYSYVHGDPINFSDPTGLFQGRPDAARTNRLLTRLSTFQNASPHVKFFRENLLSKTQVLYGAFQGAYQGYGGAGEIAIRSDTTEDEQAITLYHELLHEVANKNPKSVPCEVRELGQKKNRYRRYIHAWIYVMEGEVVDLMPLSDGQILNQSVPLRAYQIYRDTGSWDRVVQYLDQRNVPDHLR